MVILWIVTEVLSSDPAAINFALLFNFLGGEKWALLAALTLLNYHSKYGDQKKLLFPNLCGDKTWFDYMPLDEKSSLYNYWQFI